MVEGEIEELKEQLNRLIGEGMDLSEVYELSVELDKLIVEYYKGSGTLLSEQVE